MSSVVSFPLLLLLLLLSETLSELRFLLLLLLLLVVVVKVAQTHRQRHTEMTGSNFVRASRVSSSARVTEVLHRARTLCYAFHEWTTNEHTQRTSIVSSMDDDG